MFDVEWDLPPELEDALSSYYSAFEPPASFAVSLEHELRQRQIELLQHRGRAAYATPGAPVEAPLGAPFPSPIRFSLREKRGIENTFRTRPILALIVLLIALSLLTGVAYAIGRLAGFIPGFGFTADVRSVHVLSEPVEVTSGGITLRVDQAVGDESKFWVSMTAVGLPDEQDFSQAFLFLAGGEMIPPQMGGGMQAEADGVHLTYIFPPLPTAAGDLTLLVENLGGQSFRIPVQLRLAKQNDILPAEPEQPVQLRSETQDGITLVLDHIAPDADKTIFQVSIRFDQPGMILNGDWNVTLMDQNGAIYPAIDITPNTMDGNAKIFQTSPFNGNEQLMLSLNVFPEANNLPVSIDFSTDSASGFLFDPGPNPVVGQSWPLDEVIRAGDFTLRAVKASLTSPTELFFEFDPLENLTSVMLYSSDPLLRGATGGVPQESGKILAGMSFEQIPAHPFEVRLIRVFYTAHGSWEIRWQPPAAPQGSFAQATKISTPANRPTATPTLDTSNPVVLEVQRLAQQFDAPFQEGPAWIHSVTERTSNPRPGQIYPLPYLISEQWIETDASGYVIRSVWIDKDANGKTIQLSATVGDYSVNFTTGDADFNPSQPYRYSADILTHDLARAEQYGITVTREETPGDDGQPCIAITSLESFPQPTLFAGESKAFIGSGNTVWINRLTGQQIQFQSFWRLEDGTDKVESTERYLLVEKVSLPPQEILDILARVVVP